MNSLDHSQLEYLTEEDDPKLSIFTYNKPRKNKVEEKVQNGEEFFPVEQNKHHTLPYMTKKKDDIVSYYKGKKIKKFSVPFETFLYRDLIWKMNYSNELNI